jgi:hypothetical protein
MADYRIIVDGDPVPASDQVYHQVGELPWRITVGASIRIGDQSYRVDSSEWRQSTKELLLSLTPLGQRSTQPDSLPPAAD